MATLIHRKKIAGTVARELRKEDLTLPGLAHGRLEESGDFAEYTAPALTAAASRVLTPSLPKMCSRCFFTVRGLMRRLAPISAFDCPRAIQRRTSASRRERPSFLKAGIAAALSMRTLFAREPGSRGGLERSRGKKEASVKWHCLPRLLQSCEIILGRERSGSQYAFRRITHRILLLLQGLH